MSTKAIREALRALKTVVVELGPMIPGHEDALLGCNEAMAELEAVDNAAGSLCAMLLGDEGHEPSEAELMKIRDAYNDALELMAAIARQEKP